MTRAELDKKPAEVAAMFDSVAGRYDLMNDILSMGQVRLWRQRVKRILAPLPGERVLDLAAGTGTSSVVFAQAGADCVACDFSLGMLTSGKARLLASGGPKGAAEISEGLGPVRAQRSEAEQARSAGGAAEGSEGRATLPATPAGGHPVSRAGARGFGGAWPGSRIRHRAASRSWVSGGSKGGAAPLGGTAGAEFREDFGPARASGSEASEPASAGGAAEGSEGRATLPATPAGGIGRAAPGPGGFAGPGRRSPISNAGVPGLGSGGSKGGAAPLGNAAPLGGAVSFAAGDAMRLPFKDDSFDAVTISFGLRNVHGTLAALREMYRVTRPGGRLVVCEFSRITVPPIDMLYRRYLTGALPAIARRVARNPVAYEYLAESIGDWPAQRELAAVIGAAGWSSVKWRNVSLGIVAIHVGRKLTGAV